MAARCFRWSRASARGVEGTSSGRITSPPDGPTSPLHVLRGAIMTVRVERSGPVTTVIHHRPEVRNAMDPASAEALVEAFLAFEADAQASVAVLWGEGGAFCAGWDLKYGASLAD